MSYVTKSQQLSWWMLAMALAQGQAIAAQPADTSDAKPHVSADGMVHLPAEQKVIAGVRVQVVTPKEGVAPKNRNRVLINLHGGGFLWGEGNGARAESIPIAGIGKITVITIAYRMAPEFRFPAASEDVAAVYRELLKKRRAADIGIYGCSAGGILTAESIAWFQKANLPMPGAIGTFCGSAAVPGGDSRYVAPLLTGGLPPPTSAVASLSIMPYFSGTSSSDPWCCRPAHSECWPAFRLRY